VILIDVNLLIYATYRRFEQHAVAMTWLDQQMDGTQRVGFPWATLLGFMRLATNPRLVPRPMTTPEAWSRVKDWLSASNAWIPSPGERHPDILEEMLKAPGVQGKLVPDAHLAALALEHGLTLCSTDGDFARFPKLRWLNPIA